MTRAGFLKRMAFAAAACAFVRASLPGIRWREAREYVAWIGDRGFYTLGDALDAAQFGDTVWVAPGQVIVDRPIPERLTIRGGWTAHV